LEGNDLEGPVVRTLMASPLMGRLTWLDLKDNGSLGVSATRALANSPAAATLQTLNVSYTNIGRSGLRDLLVSPFLTSLTSLAAAGIRLHGITDAGVAELIASPVLRRLTALDLALFPGPR
jgi:hypothetical protein